MAVFFLLIAPLCLVSVLKLGVSLGMFLAIVEKPTKIVTIIVSLVNEGKKRIFQRLNGNVI